MYIALTKKFLTCFSRIVEKDDILGEAIIKALLNLKNEYKLDGLNVENIRASNFKSARVTRDYRIIFDQDGNVAYLLFLGQHREAYNWATSNKAIQYHDYFVGYWDSSDYDETQGDVLEESEYYAGFDKQFQLRLQSCSTSDELIKVCEGLAPEYKEIIYSHNTVNNVLEKYSSEILVAENDDDLIEALKKPFEEWLVFLHPVQKSIIDYPENKNLCIKGGPGTGKTVSLVHRLVTFLEKGNKCILISKSEPTVDVIKNMVAKLNPNLNLNYFLMDDINEENIQTLFEIYDYFFFDELQDIGKHECQVLNNMFKLNNKHFTAAYDLNQAVITTRNKKELFDFAQMADESKILNYNYRCTDEIFMAAADFIKLQYGFLKQDTFEMDFALVGDEVDSYEGDDAEIDYDIQEYVFENNLINSGDWAIVFVGYYNRDRYDSLKKMFPDNVYNVLECKGMDFKAGCVIIYNENFDVDNKTGFKEFNAQSYVAITRFRESVSLFLVYKKYGDTPQKIISNIYSNASTSKERERNKANRQYRKKEGMKVKSKKPVLKVKNDKGKIENY